MYWSKIVAQVEAALKSPQAAAVELAILKEAAPGILELAPWAAPILASFEQVLANAAGTPSTP